MDIIDREIERRLRQRPNFQNINVSARALESGVVKPGLNYCSEIFRFTISYEKHGHKYVKSFVVKAPYGLRFYEFFKQSQLFTKEIYMYNVVFPLFQSLLPNQSLQPEFYGTDGNEALILEDLSYSGYKLKDGHEQLDFEHTVEALKLLAKFHALSVRVHEIMPTILDTVRDETYFTSDYLRLRACIVPIFNRRFEKILRRAAPSYAQEHSQALHLLQMNGSWLKTVVQELRPERYSFCVLNHGDFHTHNIMFAYDELGQVKNAKCLDFQSCRWSSPAIDIVHFCITSVRPPVFENYFHLLLETYSQTLNATLDYLKSDCRLRTDTLRKDVDRISAYWTYTLAAISPLIVSNQQNDLHDTLADEFLDDEYYVELTRFWLPYLIQKGVFSKWEEAALCVSPYSHEFQGENEMKTSKDDFQYDETKIDANFLSGRVLLNFNSQSSIFLKIPSPRNNHQNIDSMGTHHREIFMYENVLPKLFEMSNGEHYAPLCHAVTENKGLVLEDLEAQGYRVYDGRTQFDSDHCHVALTALAKYHALSVKYLQSSSCIIDDTLSQMPDFGPHLMALCCDLYDRFLNLAKTQVSTPAHQKLREYKKQLDLKWTSVFQTNRIPNGFGIIAHGNFCIYNILFKYDENGRVHEAKMVNWQMSRRASPVLDLIYFFVGSVRFEVFKAHGDTLLKLYVDTLNETLSALKCNGSYTRTDLDRDLDVNKILFPIYASCILQVVMTAKLSQANSFQRNNDLSPDNYSTVVAKWLNYFVENGII